MESKQKEKLNRTRLLAAALGAGAFLSDLASKQWVLTAIPFGTSIPVIPGFLDFTDVLNSGVAFSFAENYPSMIITLIAAVLACYLIYVFTRKKNPVILSGLALVIGGTLGNIFDRLVRGAVVDFIHFTLFGMSMPIFNLADTWIFCGICIWILGEFLEEKKHDAKKH